MKTIRAALCVAVACLFPSHVDAHVSNKNIKLSLNETVVETTEFGRFHGSSHYADNAVEVDTVGTSAYLQGKIYAAFKLPSTVTVNYDTVMEFSVDVAEDAQVAAVCLEENKAFNWGQERCMAFGGTVDVASNSHYYKLQDQTAAGQQHDYVIPIGHLYQTYDINYLVLIQHDSNVNKGKYTISDIKVYDTTNTAANDDIASLVYSDSGTEKTADSYQHPYHTNQDTRENFLTFSTDGKTVNVKGNVWKAIELDTPHTVTQHTMGYFSAELVEVAEINAICFEVDLVFANDWPNRRCFSFGGTENVNGHFVRLDYNTVGGGYKDYAAPIGHYLAGTEIKYIVFMQDKDSNRYSGEMNVKNIALAEGEKFNVELYGTSTEIEVIESYGGGQDHGYRVAEITDDGNSVTFRGNTWRAFAIDYEITRSTYISFQIDIDEIAEVVAVCLDENLVYGGATQDRYQCLAVSGTQSVVTDRNFQMLSPYLSAGESHTYLFRPSDLPVQLQGEYKYLAFMLDKDSARDDGIATLSNVKIFEPEPSCLATVSWSFTFDECSTTKLVPKLKETFDANCQGSANSFEVDLLEFFDGDAEKGIHELCDSAYIDKSLTEITLEEDQFIREYFDGGNTWNYEVDEKGEPISNSAARVKFAYDNFAQKKQIAMPETHQFLNCELRSAMCCFVADRQANDNNGNCADGDCDDADPADNTDLCYVDMKRSQVSSRVRDGWSIYPGDTEGAVHCHGIAWGNNAGAEDQFKGNNLFYVSMYDHMYTRGYVEQVQGAPMCGCIEQMPVVSRSDCTQVDVTQSVTVSYDKDTTLLSAAGTITNIEFNSCQGADNNNNDLAAYYQQLVNDGKATAYEKAKFDTYVVGDNNCDAATTSFLAAKGLNYATTN